MSKSLRFKLLDRHVDVLLDYSSHPLSTAYRRVWWLPTASFKGKADCALYCFLVRRGESDEE